MHVKHNATYATEKGRGEKGRGERWRRGNGRKPGTFEERGRGYQADRRSHTQRLIDSLRDALTHTEQQQQQHRRQQQRHHQQGGARGARGARSFPQGNSGPVPQCSPWVCLGSHGEPRGDPGSHGETRGAMGTQETRRGAPETRGVEPRGLTGSSDSSRSAESSISESILDKRRKRSHSGEERRVPPHLRRSAHAGQVGGDGGDGGGVGMRMRIGDRVTGTASLPFSPRDLGERGKWGRSKSDFRAHEAPSRDPVTPGWGDGGAGLVGVESCCVEGGSGCDL
ncbi:unnamed protein product [Lampetra fluviatilis]